MFNKKRIVASLLAFSLVTSNISVISLADEIVQEEEIMVKNTEGEEGTGEEGTGGEGTGGEGTGGEGTGGEGTGEEGIGEEDNEVNISELAKKALDVAKETLSNDDLKKASDLINKLDDGEEKNLLKKN